MQPTQHLSNKTPKCFHANTNLNATFAKQWVKTKHHHKSCIQLAPNQKNTISARHCSAADVLKTTQMKTTLAVP